MTPVLPRPTGQVDPTAGTSDLFTHVLRLIFVLVLGAVGWSLASDPRIASGPSEGGPYTKILFGTDVGADQVAEVKGDYERLVADLGLSDEQIANVFGGNAQRALNLP